MYRRIKWIWLLARCALPVLAMLYLVSVSGSGISFRVILPWLPESLAVFLMQIGGSFYLVIWLIAESLLSMYRFPLDLRGALVLVAGYFIQMIVLSITGESVSFAAYVTMYVTLAALFVCIVWLSGLSLRKHLKQLLAQPLRRMIGIALAVRQIGVSPS